MEHFRNYEKMNFNFEPNRFCAITGPNGAGKTTLAIDGICWCIYDETSKGRKGDAVIRKRSGKNTRVVLKFSIDNDEYMIENNRKHDQYGDMKVLKMNNNPISGANRSETNKRIVDILMPKDVFKNCLLFSQYINKPFAEMGDVGQKNIFDLMMGFNKYNEYYEKSKEYIKNIEKELSRFGEDLLLLSKSSERNRELLKSELENRAKLIDAYETRKINLELEIQDRIHEDVRLKKEICDNGDLIGKYRRKQNDISEVTSNIAIVRNKFESEKQLAITNINSDKKNEQTKVEKEFRDVLNNINTEIESINNSYSLLKQEINAKNESLKSEYYKKESEIEAPIRDELDIVTSEYKDAINESHMFVRAIYDLKEQWDSLIKNAKDINDKLNQEVPTCYTCKQEIRGINLEEVKLLYEEEKVKIAKCNEEMEQLESNKINVDKTVAEKELYIKALKDKKETALTELNSWKTEELRKLQEYRDNSLTDLKNREVKANAEKDNIDNEISGHIDSLEVKYDSILSDRVNVLAGNFTSSIRNLEAKFKDLETDKIILEEMIEHERIINHKISLNNGTIQGKKEELDNLIPSHKELLDERNLKIQKLKEIVDEDMTEETSIKDNIKKSERKITIGKFWKKAFSPKGIRAILLDESMPTLNEKAKELSSRTDCIRVRFSSQKPLKSGELRNQFCVLPIQTTNLTDEREDFSAGEGRMVDIITLLSLRHLLEVTYERTFNISLFDEILDSLYRDNAEVVIDFLRKMSEESCTILITHTLKNYIEPDEHLELGR